MNMKIFAVSAIVSAVFVAGCNTACNTESAAALDELMPVPVKVEAAGGTVCSSVTGNVSVTVAPVPGARKETADEAYVLEVGRDGVRITAPTKRGELWARVTLDQLVRLSGGNVPCCRITDWPRFKWRGFMHDSGRNFLEVEHVKGLIDAMSRCKMNLFHWHFTEYYGWRLESKVYPELQRDSSFYIRYIGKYYTHQEFRDVVAYAAAKGVTVMPEFDIPGHALAFRRAFGFKTMRDEGVREKLCDLVDELCSLASKELMPFIHLGSDEARLPEEKVPPQWMAPIVDRVHANGRIVVGWTPGELAGLTDRGPVVGMRWGTPKDPGSVGKIPFFDATGMYVDALDPFEIPSVATYRRICPWDDSDGERLGAITCAWHDDFAGTGVRTIGNQTVSPALVLFGDAYWRGRDDEPTGNNGRILPRGGDPRLAKAADIERRTAAQRDKVWYDCPYPFQFLRQTDMRWRVSLSDGTLLATNVAQATMFLWQRATQGVEGGKGGSVAGNLTTNRTGIAILETWIKSPADIDCGAWIGFTDYTRDHGRAYSAPTPALGQWSRFDATVEINGKKVAPPKWKRPGQEAGPDVEHLLYVHRLDEIAFEDEEYYMREPTPIRLEKGWNHVKLTVPMKKPARNHAPWVGTFIPLFGTTERPYEVPGLEYSSSPKGKPR